jgi:plasmid stabilization system protein ParE
MRRLFVTPEARQDLREAKRWYEQQREGLGAAFQHAAESIFSQFQSRPLSFPPLVKPFHRASLHRYPYQALYRFNDEMVLIVMLFHTSRDPATAFARLRAH